ncbi:hypothetical protein V2W45_309136 [Cenococcum geophilum]
MRTNWQHRWIAEIGSRPNPRTAAWVHDFSAMLFGKLLSTLEAPEILVKDNLALLLGEDPALLLEKDENFTNIVSHNKLIREFAKSRFSNLSEFRPILVVST